MRTNSLRRALANSSFATACAAVLAAPWLFGAWEMWWFWPLACLIFLSSLLFGLEIIAAYSSPRRSEDDEDLPGRGEKRLSARFTPALACFALFLAYAFVRFLQADVRMDAERSFLLFFTPFLLSLQIVYGWSLARRRLLLELIMFDLCLLGVYGLVNHSLGAARFLFLGAHRVMWMPGYAQYIAENRATGSYFCPDHFSGIMEIAFGLGLGLAFSRGLAAKWKWFAVLLATVGFAGVLASKSRGGGLTLLAVVAGALVFGLGEWPEATRRRARTAACLCTAAVLLALAGLGTAYAERFCRYFGFEQARGRPLKAVAATALEKVRAGDRAQMIAGAIRAWRDRPVFGIGPGMHQNLWPHYAASADGDREAGKWPTFVNNTFHSYEVHSDWVQLLEEYGIVGFTLFLSFAVFLFLAFAGRLRHAAEMPAVPRSRKLTVHAVTLGSFLTLVAMAFHSLGDFNLQMPATTWLLAVVGAVGAGERAHGGLDLESQWPET